MLQYSYTELVLLQLYTLYIINTNILEHDEYILTKLQKVVT